MGTQRHSSEIHLTQEISWQVAILSTHFLTYEMSLIMASYQVYLSRELNKLTHVYYIRKTLGKNSKYSINVSC